MSGVLLNHQDPNLVRSSVSSSHGSYVTLRSLTSSETGVQLPSPHVKISLVLLFITVIKVIRSIGLSTSGKPFSVVVSISNDQIPIWDISNGTSSGYFSERY